mgnify:CR=1 FL=1
MDYDFSPLNSVLTEFSDKIKALPMPNLSPELLAALDNFSRNPQISSIQETARKFQMYYSNLYNPDLTATAISQAASKALNIPYDYDSISGAVSAMASYAKTLSTLNTTSSGMDSIVSAVSSALTSLDSSEDFPEDDYVTIDEAPIKEWEIPDTIAIPIGHNRIRMKTDIFIVFIGSIVIPLIFNLAGLIVDLSAAISESKNETYRIELEEERNTLINESNQLFDRYLDILDSTDASDSSKADQIEHWKESLPKPDSAPIVSDSTPDSHQGSHNSNPE